MTTTGRIVTRLGPPAGWHIIPIIVGVPVRHCNAGIALIDGKRKYGIRCSEFDGLCGVRVNAKEAKDFLVEQAAQQAALEKVPLSNVEKRMMYFVENDPSSCEDPLALNDEFEAQCDTAEYEARCLVFSTTLTSG